MTHTHPTPAPALAGAATLTWYSLWKLLTNPFIIGFSIGLPIVMYTMFGVGKDYSDIWIGHANIAATILANMALYGVLVSASSMGTNVSLERISGVSRLFAMTPLSSSVIIFTRVLASLGVSIIVITVAYIFGYATQARMNPGTWITTGTFIVLSSILATVLGLAIGYAVRSDGAFAAASMIIVVCAFLSGMFIPLEEMGSFFKNLAPWSPFYGILNIVQYPMYEGGTFEWKWLAGALAWTVFFVIIAAWAQSRDTTR
ncbi:MAG: ABC transporter [Actinobacteria bacterium]|nr:MAG: ABC transporter [Actinomycetota bacterium]